MRGGYNNDDNYLVEKIKTNKCAAREKNPKINITILKYFFAKRGFLFFIFFCPTNFRRFYYTFSQIILLKGFKYGLS